MYLFAVSYTVLYTSYCRPLTWWAIVYGVFQFSPGKFLHSIYRVRSIMEILFSFVSIWWYFLFRSSRIFCCYTSQHYTDICIWLWLFIYIIILLLVSAWMCAPNTPPLPLSLSLFFCFIFIPCLFIRYSAMFDVSTYFHSFLFIARSLFPEGL